MVRGKARQIGAERKVGRPPKFTEKLRFQRNYARGCVLRDAKLYFLRTIGLRDLLDRP